MKTRSVAILASSSLALLAATPALAHTGHAAGNGLLAGLLHPLAGLDHLLAMVAIGMWAAQQHGRLRLAVPLTFLLTLLAGFLLGLGGGVLPLMESGIAVSVLILGLLVAAAARLPVWVSLALSGGFALLHGYAHGSELAVGTAASAFAVGFLSTSLLLQLAGGTVLNTLKQRVPLAVRSAGLAISAIGAGLLAMA